MVRPTAPSPVTNSYRIPVVPTQLPVEVPSRDHACFEGAVHEPRALRIARKGLNLELLEQPAKLSLDRLDAEHELLSDVAVGRRFSEFASVAIGAAEGNQHASLRGR